MRIQAVETIDTYYTESMCTFEEGKEEYVGNEMGEESDEDYI